MVTSYCPRLDEHPVTPEQLQLRKKVQKGEKRMRKREEKIRRYTKKAQNAKEEAILRREIIQKMSDKAKKFMEKRKAQWERQKQKVVAVRISLGLKNQIIDRRLSLINRLCPIAP